MSGCYLRPGAASVPGVPPRAADGCTQLGRSHGNRQSLSPSQGSITCRGPFALLQRAGVMPLHAETLLFHSSERCQSKSQEGLFLALSSVVT